MEQKKITFIPNFILLSIGIIVTLVFIQKGDKDRSAFQKISGKIVSIENSFERYPGKDTSKFRYILINNYPIPFEIFVGKSKYDFKPNVEQISLLKVGDSLTIYFDEKYTTKNEPVNNLAYFIDRKSEVIFVKGNAGKIFFLGFIIFCGILLVVITFLKKKGKIN